MIPGSIRYHRPATVADAVKLLVDFGARPGRLPRPQLVR